MTLEPDSKDCKQQLAIGQGQNCTLWPFLLPIFTQPLPHLLQGRPRLHFIVLVPAYQAGVFLVRRSSSWANS